MFLWKNFFGMIWEFFLAYEENISIAENADGTLTLVKSITGMYTELVMVDTVV